MSAAAHSGRLESAIRWALGEEGDFRPRNGVMLEGAYYWRTELRERAAMTAKPL